MIELPTHVTNATDALRNLMSCTEARTNFPNPHTGLISVRNKLISREKGMICKTRHPDRESCKFEAKEGKVGLLECNP